MVTKIHRDALRSEIASVRAMLDRRGTLDRLGSLSLRQRLNTLEKQLLSAEGEVRNIANVALVFDGGSVRGSSAIDADFAGKALQDYQDLVTKQMASSNLGVLAERGPLPVAQQKQSRLNITDLVHGSFGFILEEDSADQSQMFESPTMQAVSDVTDMLEGISSADGHWFNERLSDLDVRVFQTLKKFVSLLYKTASTLKLAEEDREIKLDPAGVFRAYERVSQTEVDEVEENFVGELLGLVPIQRRFDFRKDENDEIVSGTVAVSLSADYLERIERDGLVAGRSWRAVIRTKTIQRADGRRPTVTQTLIDLLKIETKT